MLCGQGINFTDGGGKSSLAKIAKGNYLQTVENKPMKICIYIF